MKEKFAMRFRNASLNTLGRTHERNEMNTLHFKIRCFVATSFFLCLIFVSSPELVGQERSLEEKRADLKEKSKLMGENFRRMKSRFVESSSRFQFDVKFAPEQVFSERFLKSDPRIAELLTSSDVAEELAIADSDFQAIKEKSVAIKDLWKTTLFDAFASGNTEVLSDYEKAVEEHGEYVDSKLSSSQKSKLQQIRMSQLSRVRNHAE